MLADGSMSVAEFMGVSRDAGLAAYYSVALAANVYSVFGLIEKPAAWCLFRCVPRDYYRRVHTMSRQKLAMKVVGWGVSAKVVFELVTDERSGN